MVAAQIGRVAIATAYDGGVALQPESQQGAGIRDETALLVVNLDVDHCHVMPVGSYLLVSVIMRLPFL